MVWVKGWLDLTGFKQDHSGHLLRTEGRLWRDKAKKPTRLFSSPTEHRKGSQRFVQSLGRIWCHYWLKDGEGPVIRNVDIYTCWEWPVADTQQGNRNFSSTMVRKWFCQQPVSWKGPRWELRASKHFDTSPVRSWASNAAAMSLDFWPTGRYCEMTHLCCFEPLYVG